MTTTSPPKPPSQRFSRFGGSGNVIGPLVAGGGEQTRRLVSIVSRFTGDGSGVPWRLVVVLVAFMVVLVVTSHAVNESLHDLYANKLETIVDADVIALRIWAEGKRDVAETIAADPEVVMYVSELLRVVDGAPADVGTALRAVAAPPNLLGFMQQTLDLMRSDRMFVIDRTGLVLNVTGSFQSQAIGRRLSSMGATMLSPTLDGQTIVHRPPASESLVEDEAFVKQAKQLNSPIMVATPVVINGGVVATLAFSVDADEFTEILAVAWVGSTGEAYAFDDRGVMVSNSRFEDDLRAAGLIPEATAEGEFVGVPLRDPGGNVMKGYRPKGPIEQRPLTRMAAEAVSGVNGLDLDGYRNYRGATVIGAWRWLDEFGFGVATEVEADEAFAALVPLRRAQVALLVLLAIATAMVLSAVYSLRVLARRVEEVQQLGQYTLERKIGEGAMGTVYRARHTMLQRPTALKMLKPHVLTEESLARFEREVRLTSELTHPNTVEVYDFGRSADGIFYYVMEFLPGLSLAELLEHNGAIPPGRVIYILKRAASALEEAHAIGLIHRDIKPANIMLCRPGAQADVVKVLDFGLVKEVNTPEELQMTAPDIVGGTPPYIPPERLKDPRCLDPRSDLYALGVVGFNLLTGRATFDGSTAMEICYKVLHDDPQRPSEFAEDVPPGLDDLIFRCLARDPDERPANASEMIEVLSGIPERYNWNMSMARRWWDEHEAMLEKVGEQRAD